MMEKEKMKCVTSYETIYTLSQYEYAPNRRHLITKAVIFLDVFFYAYFLVEL